MNQSMANTKSRKTIEIPEDDEEKEDDLEFLYQLEAAEAHALSLSSVKRRRISVVHSDNKLEQTVKEEEEEEEEEEGAYTAALKGSKSLTWQKQQQNYFSKRSFDSFVAPTGGGGGGGGGCFRCGKEGHWARECPQVTSSVATVGPTFSTTTAAMTAEKACPCGVGSCLVLTANTERNRGRKFFRCPLRQENGGCTFFEWCDESSGNRTPAEGKYGGQQQPYQHPANRAASAFTKSWNDFDKGTSAINSSYGQKSETTENRGYSMKSDSTCFKCGQQGHWAKDCLTRSSDKTGGIKTSTSVTAGARGNTSSDACYKCGQSGHWARDCPQGQSTKLRSW